jgi:FkbM family methyltransferase
LTLLRAPCDLAENSQRILELFMAQAGRDGAPRPGDDRIVIYHVGGEGDYGPTMRVIKQLAARIHLVVFEARADTTDAQQSETNNRHGIKTSVIFKGIDERAGSADFYVNKFPLSSSLLKSSPIGRLEDPGYPHVHTWGQNTEIHHVIKVDTVSIDDIVASGAVPPPDIISIDAQGAEFRILKGARKALGSALAVVSEVEFSEIYDGQGLFDDQMALLGGDGFRLFNIAGPQFWHPGPAAGRGFFTVGEAVFLRYAADLPRLAGKRGYVPFEELSEAQLVKLAAIAYGFGAYSYVFTIMQKLKQRNPAAVAEMAADSTYRPVAKLHAKMERRMGDYARNQRVFLRSIRTKRGYSIGEWLLHHLPGYKRAVMTKGAM